jgi:hypothetical protein
MQDLIRQAAFGAFAKQYLFPFALGLRRCPLIYPY